MQHAGYTIHALQHMYMCTSEDAAHLLMPTTTTAHTHTHTHTHTLCLSLFSFVLAGWCSPSRRTRRQVALGVRKVSVDRVLTLGVFIGHQRVHPPLDALA